MIEIASVVGCSVDTLEKRFSDLIKKGRESGKASLRRQQWALAQKGDKTMLIWLGKQYLGQRDQEPQTYDDKREANGLAVALANKMQKLIEERDVTKDTTEQPKVYAVPTPLPGLLNSPQ
jgi:hypothetical protein